MIKYTILKKHFLIFSLFCGASCRQHQAQNGNCSYLISDLFKNYDSSKFEIKKSRTKDRVDIFESVDTSSGEKNLYQFDNNNRLRFYAFLIDSTYGYDFGIEYDSSGNIIKKTGPEIVRWYLYKLGKDSLEVSFLLYSIQYSYRKPNLFIGNDSFKNVVLFKSKFSNLVGNKVRVRNWLQSDDSTKKMAYVTGLKVNRCTHDTTMFRDSVYLPAAKKIIVNSKPKAN